MQPNMTKQQRHSEDRVTRTACSARTAGGRRCRFCGSSELHRFGGGHDGGGSGGVWRRDCNRPGSFPSLLLPMFALSRRLIAAPVLARTFAAEAAATAEKFDELRFNFAVPDRVLVDNKSVTRVTLPGRGGTMGIEKNMPPVVTELRPGVVLVEYEKGEKEEFFVPVRGRGKRPAWVGRRCLRCLSAGFGRVAAGWLPCAALFCSVIMLACLLQQCVGGCPLGVPLACPFSVFGVANLPLLRVLAVFWPTWAPVSPPIPVESSFWSVYLPVRRRDPYALGERRAASLSSTPTTPSSSTRRRA